MDRIKEKLTYYRTLVTLFWTGLFILGSGITWSLLNLKGLYFAVIPKVGILMEICLFIFIIVLDFKIRKLIKEL